VPTRLEASPKEDGGILSYDGFELEEVSVDQLQHGMETGRWTARGIAESYHQRIDAIDGLDARVAPTGHPAWPTDPVNGDHFLGSSSTPAAVSGYPSIRVPAGPCFGLPVGLSFIGKP